MLSLKNWIIRLGLLAALVLLAGAGIYASHQYRLQQALAEQLMLTRHAGREIETLLNRLATGVDRVTQTSQLHSHQPIDPDLLELLAINYPPELLLGIYQQDAEGNILTEYPPGWIKESGFPVHRLAEFTPQLNGPRLIHGTRESAIQLTQRVPNRKEPSQLSVLISTRALLQQVFDDPVNNFMFVLDHTGKILLHPNQKLIGLDFDAVARLGSDPEFGSLLTHLTQGTPEAFIIDERLLGSFDPHPHNRELALSYVPLNAFGGKWRLALATPSSSLEALGKTGPATIFLFAFGIAGMLWILSAPLRQLSSGRLSMTHSHPEQLQSQLREVRAQLAAAELRNQQLLDNAGDALFFVDPQTGAILDQNQACEKLLGYSGSELSRLSLATLLPGAQNRKYLRLMKRVLKSGYAEASDLKFRTKSGQLFTGAVHARFGALDERQVIHGVIRDVTRLKRIEQELRQRNRDLTLINQISFKATESISLSDVLATVREMVVAAFDADGGGIYLSRHQGNQLELVTHEGIADDILAELKSLPPGAGLIGRGLVSGRPVSSANLKKDRRLWSQAIRQSSWKVLQSVPLVSNEQTIGVLFVFHQITRIYNRDEVRLLQAIGQQIGMTIAGANLLDELSWQNRLTQATNRELQASRKLLSDNLKRQKEATRTLERTEKMKNNFLALASHELRTPLTYILSGSQLLLEEFAATATEQQKKILAAVHLGGKRLEEIINNLLEIARLEAQSIYLGRENIELDNLLEQLVEEFTEVLAENQLTLSVVKPLPVVKQFQGDRDHLLKTLERLVENAIKFTSPGGKISLAANTLSQRQVYDQQERLLRFREPFFQQELAPSYLQLSVSDTGIGIDPDELLQIFDKFYEIGEINLHFTSQTRFGGKGVGLGLALVKGMVEAHNGLVWVESSGTSVGGSSFHLLLPLAEPVAADLASVQPEAADHE
jgi:PAS domain S-box-containing protein